MRNAGVSNMTNWQRTQGSREIYIHGGRRDNWMEVWHIREEQVITEVGRGNRDKTSESHTHTRHKISEHNSETESVTLITGT